MYSIFELLSVSLGPVAQLELSWAAREVSKWIHDIYEKRPDEAWQYGVSPGHVGCGHAITCSIWSCYHPNLNLEYLRHI